jgi:4-hydroxybenzoate polyprenyltransferase
MGVTASLPQSSWFERLKMTLAMIKFEHSVFALPFAMVGALLAWRSLAFAVEGLAAKFGWIVVAMVGARSAAMAFNRLVDAAIDARNPRTASRHIPAGLLSARFVWLFFAVSVAAFAVASWALNPLCLALAPVALAVILGYSYMKRVSSLSHLVLGLALGIAPTAAWIAMTGSIDVRTGWLTLAVLLWTAGFDVIYACQDFEFDRSAGLHSIPAALGIRRSLWLSRAMHVAMVLALMILARSFGLGLFAWLGIAVVAALLVYEHALVRHDDLSRVNVAFFTLNGWVSVLFGIFWMVEIVWGPRPDGRG